MAKLINAPETKSILMLAAALSGLCGLFVGGCWLLLGAPLWACLGLWLAATAAIAGVSWRWCLTIRRRLVAIADQLTAPDYTPSFNDEGAFSELHNAIYRYSRQTVALQAAVQADRDQLATAITDIAHQLRTPIAAMQNVVDLLTPQNAAASKHTLVAQDKRLADLVARLILLARVDTHTLSHQRQPINVDALLRQALTPMLPLVATTDLAFDWQVPTDIVLDANAGLLEEAFVNLLKNTCEHAEAASTITVRAEKTPLTVLITMQNVGPAIPAVDLPHLFERFYRGSQSPANNLGIGLAIAKGIIEAADGRLSVANVDAGVCYRAEFFL